jgi:hypothetical protein
MSRVEEKTRQEIYLAAKDSFQDVSKDGQTTKAVAGHFAADRQGPSSVVFLPDTTSADRHGRQFSKIFSLAWSTANTPHPVFRPALYPVTFLDVKITVAHDSTKDAVKQAVDRSLDDIFTNSIALPVKLVQQHRSWVADTLTFSLIAKMGPMGLMSTPIFGTVLVTDHDLTIDVNLGLLERLIPAEKARQAISTRLKGLLK